MSLQYPARICVVDEGWLTTFPDFPETVSKSGRGVRREVVEERAAAALMHALITCQSNGVKCPMPHPPRHDDTLIDLGVDASVRVQLWNEFCKRGMTFTELARRMKTSRSQVHRILRFDMPSMTLGALTKAAIALDLRITLSIH